MNRLSVILVIVIIVVTGIIFFVGKSSDVDNGDIDDNNDTIPECISSNITRNEPLSGKLKAVIELGSEGFNYFIVEIDSKKNWELTKPKYGVQLPDLETESTILSGLRSFINEIINYGVNGVDVHFVVSSGAQKNDNIVKITGGLKELGYKVNAVSPEQEAIYGWTATVPDYLKNEAFFIDIGSGNTKVAWNGLKGPMTNELYGAKYFQKGISSENVFREIRQFAETLPGGRTKYCFIIGGVPYQMSKVTKVGDERFTCFKEASFYKLEGEKNKSGLNIYNALREGSRCQRFLFDTKANFTIGFLLTLPYET